MTTTPPEPDEPHEQHESEGLNESEKEQEGHTNNEAWDAIVADLSGQIDLGPHFRSEPAPQELIPQRDYIDEYFEEGYEPPEPPPLTVPSDAFARFAWAGALGGPVVMLLGYVLSLGRMISTAGLIATIGGFVFLMSKRDKHVPPGEDFGDGAVV
ncbi:MAG: hypothetical protein WAO33_01140 [Candidatus Nanopelagicales bacterium]|jgi:hypothetical protein|nr:hypothetical protein [Actinomycetes bacterium]